LFFRKADKRDSHFARGDRDFGISLRAGSDSGMAPQAIENTKNGLGNGKPSGHVVLAGGSMTRIRSHRSPRETFSARSGPGSAAGSATQNQGRKKLRKSAGKPLK
jgi:hypothetical protein